MDKNLKEIYIWVEPKGHEFFLGKYYPLKKHEVWWWVRSNDLKIQEWIDYGICFKKTLQNRIYRFLNKYPHVRFRLKRNLRKGGNYSS